MRFRDFGRLVLLALSVLATSARAEPTPPAAPVLDNMDFERGEIGKPPPGWFGKSIATSADRPQGGAKSLLLRNDATTPANFGRAVSAAPFRARPIHSFSGGRADRLARRSRPLAENRRPARKDAVPRQHVDSAGARRRLELG